jgi:hypothetical protein
MLHTVAQIAGYAPIGAFSLLMVLLALAVPKRPE